MSYLRITDLLTMNPGSREAKSRENWTTHLLNPATYQIQAIISYAEGVKKLKLRIHKRKQNKNISVKVTFTGITHPKPLYESKRDINQFQCANATKCHPRRAREVGSADFIEAL
ncbi:hypothetical protein H6P81_015849 [Aristolochia fimbriata]|uniref:Uncharacterized protein n=1 Tax=Aristolochia fimbriata TaxID=158543 RepID=A0AAV7E7B9_ARIFI|nr:hypothetical protein H6P81_015849 [Aristolochia fimbriata]